MDFTVRRIESSDQTVKFDCGNQQLNEYLHRYARQDQRRMFGVTYVAVCAPPSPAVIGYFTLANTSIPRNGLPEKALKGLPKYQEVPAFLLGRLAVDRSYQGKQIGELLLSRCFEHCLTIAKCSGARFLIADVKPSAVTWYERYGFQRVEGSANPDSTKMLIDLEVIRAAIDRRAEQPPVH